MGQSSINGPCSMAMLNNQSVYIDYSVFQPEWCIPIWTFFDGMFTDHEMGCSQTMGSVWPPVGGDILCMKLKQIGFRQWSKTVGTRCMGKGWKGWLWVCHIKNRSGCSGFSTPWCLRTPLDSNSQILASEHTNLSKYTINIPSSVLLWYLN
jgi:hypothetical protein